MMASSPTSETLPAPATEQRAWRLAAVGMVATLLCYAAIGGSKELVNFVAGREMLVENVGAAAFLGTALVFLRMLLRERRSSALWRRVQLGGLAFFFFVAFGEEASWGQHWLGFATPDEMKTLNAQQETNLHNLWVVDSYEADAGKTKGFEKKKGPAALLLNSNRLFDLIMIGLFWLLPAAARFPRALAALLRRWATPVPAWPFAVLLLVVFLGTAATEALLVDGMIRHLAVSEVREFGYSLLGFLAALELLRRAPPAAGAGAPRSENAS